MQDEADFSVTVTSAVTDLLQSLAAEREPWLALFDHPLGHELALAHLRLAQDQGESVPAVLQAYVRQVAATPE